MSQPAGAEPLNLLVVLEEIKREQPAPCIHHSPARGLFARAAEFEAWQEQHGGFGSYSRSHAWHPAIIAPTDPAGRCQPTLLSADIRIAHGLDVNRERACACEETNRLMYKGACCGCEWEGTARDHENSAVEDACDHSWPGWRDLPTVPRMPSENGPRDKFARDRWTEHVNGLYPPGWLEAGGPIRTVRRPAESRHVEGGTQFGGYDMNAGQRTVT